MTFEEFFQKKRIDLTRLQAGEPALFFEFKTHFEQMGEKSFDHTKKYWFNKLRLQYHLAAELKPAKVHIENRLAEQTIVETLTESAPVRAESPKPKAESAEATETPKPAFKPRFSPKMVAPKPAQEAESPAPETSAAPPVPKPAGFKPRFNAKAMAPKAEGAESVEQKAETTSAETPAEPINAKPAGFKPRFNPKMVAPKPAEEAESVEQKAESPAPETPAEPVAPKPAGFKPRFNMKMAAKPAEVVQDKAEEPVHTEASPVAEETRMPPAEATAPKPAGFKPRFNMKMVAPKPAEEEQLKVEMSEPATPEAPTDAKAEIPVTAEEPPAEDAAPKPAGFKPRFNAAKMKPKPPQE